VLNTESVLRLSEDYGAPTVLRALRYLCIRLQKFETATAIVSELEQCRSELSSAQEAFEIAYTERVAATAEVSYLDEVLDQTVLNLAAETARLLPGGSDDERYRALFPVAAAEALASTASHRQHRFVHHVLENLRSESAFGPLRSHAALIEQRQHALEASLAERELRFQAEASATRRRNEALDEACRSYNRSFSRLQLLFRDGARIESLYPNLPSLRTPDSQLS
jgi:hypothetical protein